jgi:hypothetical protein
MLLHGTKVVIGTKKIALHENFQGTMRRLTDQISTDVKILTSDGLRRAG